MRVAEALGRGVAQLGVRNCFGLVGSGNFHLANAMIASGVRFVAARHETGAVTMADAYARSSRSLGVCTVHQGPGLTNAITGLTEAAKSRTPMLLLTAETTSPLSNFFVDVGALTAGAGAVHRRLGSPESAVEDLAAAAAIAVGERRTVVVSMPLEIQAAECESAATLSSPPPPVAIPPTAEDARALADLFRSARRPLIIAGRGAVLSGAREPLHSSRNGPARCWRRAPSATACSRATRGTSGSAADSLLPWRPS